MRCRSVLIAVAVTLVLIGGSLVAMWGFGRKLAIRTHISYFTEEERLYREYERDMRSMIATLDGDPDEPDVREATDRVFEKLRHLGTSTDREVLHSWRDAPHSAERTAFARAWAEFAADEAAFMASVNRFYRLAFERGDTSPWYTGPAVPPRPPDLPGPVQGTDDLPRSSGQGGS